MAHSGRLTARNQLLMSSAEMRMQVADIAVNGPQAGVAHACPRCGTEARGYSDDQRADWFGKHYNARHGGYR